MPSAPVSSGSVTAGRPSSVQMVQNVGLPVFSRPRGAWPVVAGVTIMS